MSAADIVELHRSSNEVSHKAFSDRAARAALLGWQLWRSDAADGPLRYFVGRNGLVQVLPDGDAVDAFLDARCAR
jgi:hypothetical protein